MKIHQTEDYSQFKFNPYNRSIISSHVSRLVASLSKRNLMEHNPILINKDMEIIEGQHRYLAAKQLNIPIYYTVQDDASVDDIKMLNSAMLQWHSRDYLDSYIKRGFQDYIILKDFMDKYQLPISIACMMLTGDNDGVMSRGSFTKFRNGEFKVTNLNWAIDMATNMFELIPYLENNIYRSREFLYAMIKVYKYVDNAKLLHKLAMQPQKIQVRKQSKDYVRQFEDVINFHSSKPINII